MNITIPKGSEYREILAKNVAQQVMRLDAKKPWLVSIKEKKPRRTDEQNKLLWSLYTEILEKGGEALGGYTKDDLHEFFLSMHFGVEQRETFGKMREVPKHRSSNLSKGDFSELVEHIVQFMAEQGVVIEMPDDL
jgi:hypothetical protein